MSVVMEEPDTRGASGTDLLTLYDDALPHVYGYLVRRCGDRAVAEDLTSETFMAAVTATNRSPSGAITAAWLMTVARNKLADHWRRVERSERHLALVPNTEGVTDAEQDADHELLAELDAARAHATLAQLGAHHRAALTFRYLDGMAVSQVATQLDRTLHATEALLVRARRAFRVAYAEQGDAGDA